VARRQSFGRRELDNEAQNNRKNANKRAADDELNASREALRQQQAEIKRIS
jgi:hypothetical protein